jgi:hypothetical protein
LGPSPVFSICSFGLDSAFAFMEGIPTRHSDTEYFKDTPDERRLQPYFVSSCPSCTADRCGLNHGWMRLILH